jgi:rare lipoprotein A
MRPQILLRAVPAAAAAGALGIATPNAAAAPAAHLNLSNETIQAAVQDASLRPGQPVVVAGRLASGQSGAPVRLELLPAGGGSWVTLQSATTGPDGRFALTARPRRSGDVRVVQAAVAQAAEADAAGVPASARRRVAVGARLVTHGVRRNVTAGRRALVRGAVAGGGSDRTVALQFRGRHGWFTVDRDRTDGQGRFRLAQRLTSASSTSARLRFAGDVRNAASTRSIGRIAGFRAAYASWYGPGLYGNALGCGGTLTAGTIGVAHKTLPCGTKLTLRYRGRTVQASVVDRGPFVGGREFDLTSATAQRLHFAALGTIQVSER